MTVPGTTMPWRTFLWASLLVDSPLLLIWIAHAWCA